MDSFDTNYSKGFSQPKGAQNWTGHYNQHSIVTVCHLPSFFFCYDSVLWTKIHEHCVLIHFEDKKHNAINVAPVAFLLKILVCYGAICLIRIWAKVHMYCSQSFDWDGFFVCLEDWRSSFCICQKNKQKMPHCMSCISYVTLHCFLLLLF